MGFLKDGERLDDLECEGLKLIQHAKKFCFGMDAVLLSSYVRADKMHRIIDLGTGTGIIPILLSSKTRAREIVGLELQADMSDMANRSVRFNRLQDRVRIVQGDIREIKHLFLPGEFHVVTSNPPYMKAQSGLVNPKESLSIARHEIHCNVDDLMVAAAYLLKENGRFFLVHRPNRLIDIITSMKKYSLEPKRITFVHPYVHKSPNIVLVEALKGGGSFLTIEKPLIIYESTGVYTKELLAQYGK